MRAHFTTGNLWWLLPPSAALFYPLALRALYESGKLLHRASGPGHAVAWLAVVVSAGLVYSVPAMGIGVACLLGRHERTSSPGLLARRIAHLAVASPPLFVLVGVVFFLLHSPSNDRNVLVDPVADRPCGSGMDHAPAKPGNTRFFQT